MKQLLSRMMINRYAVLWTLFLFCQTLVRSGWNSSRTSRLVLGFWHWTGDHFFENLLMFNTRISHTNSFLALSAHAQMPGTRVVTSYFWLHAGFFSCIVWTVGLKFWQQNIFALKSRRCEQFNNKCRKWRSRVWYFILADGKAYIHRFYSIV